MVVVVVDSNFHGNNDSDILPTYEQDDDSLIATLCVKYCMIAGRSNATTH